MASARAVARRLGAIGRAAGAAGDAPGDLAMGMRSMSQSARRMKQREAALRLAAVGRAAAQAAREAASAGSWWVGVSGSEFGSLAAAQAARMRESRFGRIRGSHLSLGVTDERGEG